MIDANAAKQLAQDVLRTIQTNVGSEYLVIIDKSTREESFGWVFCWNDKRFLETSDDIYALAGKLPIVVLRKTGEVGYLPWEGDLDSSIRSFGTNVSKRNCSA